MYVVSHNFLGGGNQLFFQHAEAHIGGLQSWLVDVECVVCAKQAEIAIILDHSTSIVDPSRGGYDNWEGPVRGFVTKLIEAFPIGPTLTRVGMVGFSTQAWLEYSFTAYSNSRTMIDAINLIDIRGGETNIAKVN